MIAGLLAVLVVVILIAITLTAIGLAIFTHKDVGPFVAAIINLMGTLIAALVGYLAGRTTNGHNGK